MTAFTLLFRDLAAPFFLMNSYGPTAPSATDTGDMTTALSCTGDTSLDKIKSCSQYGI